MIKKKVVVEIEIEPGEDYEESLLMISEWMGKCIPWPYEIFREDIELHRGTTYTAFIEPNYERITIMPDIGTRKMNKFLGKPSSLPWAFKVEWGPIPLHTLGPHSGYREDHLFAKMKSRMPEKEPQGVEA